MTAVLTAKRFQTERQKGVQAEAEAAAAAKLQAAHRGKVTRQEVAQVKAGAEEAERGEVAARTTQRLQAARLLEWADT